VTYGSFSLGAWPEAMRRSAIAERRVREKFMVVVGDSF
jgi:hypothetical protein